MVQIVKRLKLNMSSNYNPRRLGEAIRHYFENPRAAEVIIFKGKREISIKRNDISKDFIKFFIRVYTK